MIVRMEGLKVSAWKYKGKPKRLSAFVGLYKATVKSSIVLFSLIDGLYRRGVLVPKKKKIERKLRDNSIKNIIINHKKNP
jgi:hypothetical protein